MYRTTKKIIIPKLYGLEFIDLSMDSITVIHTQADSWHKFLLWHFLCSISRQVQWKPIFNVIIEFSISDLFFGRSHLPILWNYRRPFWHEAVSSNQVTACLMRKTMLQFQWRSLHILRLSACKLLNVDVTGCRMTCMYVCVCVGPCPGHSLSPRIKTMCSHECAAHISLC